MKPHLIIAAALIVGLSSCRWISSVGMGDVVASVGTHKLYSRDLISVIPPNASPEDSTRLALQYINSWATDLLYLDVAEKELPREARDVSKPIEEYRRALLKYRYEQEYVSQRLDTAVSRKEVEAYYENHAENFRLEIPVLKVRFLSIYEGSPALKSIKKKMSSDNAEELLEADSLAFLSAIKYDAYNDRWIDAVALAKEFGTDYTTMLSCLHDGFVEMSGGEGVLNIAYVSEMMKVGEMGPLEYFTPRIKDIILNARKRRLLNDLERDLLDRARISQNFVIY